MNSCRVTHLAPYLLQGMTTSLTRLPIIPGASLTSHLPLLAATQAAPARRLQFLHLAVTQAALVCPHNLFWQLPMLHRYVDFNWYICSPGSLSIPGARSPGALSIPDPGCTALIRSSNIPSLPRVRLLPPLLLLPLPSRPSQLTSSNTDVNARGGITAPPPHQRSRKHRRGI